MRQLILDTETTGLDPKRERLVSIAALEMIDGDLTGAFAHWHLNPEQPCNPKAAEIHGLTDEYLKTQPKFAEIEPELDRFVSNDRLVIHNAKFDLGFLTAELDRIARGRAYKVPPYTCTYERAVAARGMGKGRNTLDTLAREYGIQNLRETTGKHGALVDCLVLYGVFRHLARLSPAPLLQSQLDHFMSKGFGVHGNYPRSSPEGADLPSLPLADAPGVSADLCSVGG